MCIYIHIYAFVYMSKDTLEYLFKSFKQMSPPVAQSEEK